MSLYSNEVRDFIRSRNWPSGLVFDVRESDTPAPHLNLVFFADNWRLLTGEQALQVTQIVQEVMARLWADNIPTYVGKMENSVDFT